MQRALILTINFIKKLLVTTSALAFASIFTYIGFVVVKNLAWLFLRASVNYTPLTALVVIFGSGWLIANNTTYFKNYASKLGINVINAVKHVFNTANEFGNKVAKTLIEKIDSPVSYIERYIVGKYNQNIRQITVSDITLENSRELIKSVVINTSGIVFAGLTAYAAVGLATTAAPLFANAMLIHYPLHIATAYFGVLAYMMTYPEQASQNSIIIIEKTSEAISMIPKIGMGIGKTIGQKCIESEAPGKAMSYAYASLAAKSRELSAQVSVAATRRFRVFGNRV